jgi:hypothetical protein
MYIGALPEIPYGFDNPNQGGKCRLDRTTESNEKVAKEASGHLDHYVSDYRHTTLSIFGGLVGLFDGALNDEQDK